MQQSWRSWNEALETSLPQTATNSWKSFWNVVWCWRGYIAARKFTLYEGYEALWPHSDDKAKKENKKNQIDKDEIVTARTHMATNCKKKCVWVF